MTLSQNQTLATRVLIVMVACWTLLSQSALAQQSKQSQLQAASKESESDGNRLIYDLGSFRLQEIRPTRNETTRLSFQAYFAMSPKVSEQDLEKLKHWKHRFRDQVIVAVRTAQIKDFQEPQLQRLRRIILFRVGRMMRESVVEDILFSEFTFSME